MTVSPPGQCPLCETEGGIAALVIRYDEVWARLERDWGVTLRRETREANAPAETCTLVRCLECGLERFEPLMAGSPGFYEDLMGSTPYAHDRWDFGMARQLIDPNDVVADLGCGEGHFLDSLGTRAARSVGVDHHRAGIERMVKRGREAYACSFEEFAEREARGFDVVTSFHTLEHLADPVAMVRAAARCLRPSGRMILSVPNRDRSWREEGEPMDRPPHHVTRWGPAQMIRLAERTSLRLSPIRFEPPDLSTARAIRQRSVEARWTTVPGSVRRNAAAAWSRASVRRRPHEREVAGDGYASRGVFGHSMLVELSAP